MDAAIDFALQTMVRSAQELFDDGDQFVELQRDADSGRRRGSHSQSVSGRIAYRRRGELRHSPALFIKINADELYLKAANLAIYTNEVYFYSRIRPFFQALRPVDTLLATFYASHLDVSERRTNEILVLRDAQPDGYVECRLQSGFSDQPHLALMARKLGELHAYSYKGRLTEPQDFGPLMESLKDVYSIVAKEVGARIAQRWRMACEPLRRQPEYLEAVDRFAQILQNFPEFLRRALVAADCATSVLCHRSFCRSNALFRYGAQGPVDLMMIDWQMCHVSRAGVDLLVALYADANQQTRDEHWDGLLDEYHRGVRQTFPEISVPCVEQMMDEVKTSMALVLLMVGIRIPHRCFAAYGNVKVCETESDAYADPLTDVLRDMMKRKLLQ